MEKLQIINYELISCKHINHFREVSYWGLILYISLLKHNLFNPIFKLFILQRL